MKKQLTFRRRALIGWFGALAVLVAAIALWTRTDTTAARSGSPPPDRPQFEGIPVTESFPIRELDGRAVWQAPALATAWQVIFEEDWEAGFDSAVWTTVDRNGAANGEYKWGVRDVANPLGGGAPTGLITHEHGESLVLAGLSMVGCRIQPADDDGHKTAAVALLGPDHMDYEAVIPLVEYAAQALAARTSEG